MSSRHFRKACGSNSYLTPAAPPEDDSDGDYEPLYAKKPPQLGYAGLAVSSSSDSEADQPAEETSDEDNPQPTTSSRKKKNNKKKSRRRASKLDNGLDEIDISLLEVNAMLGTPPPAPLPEPEPQRDPFHVIMALHPKHLNVANELRRLFGPDDEQDRRFRNQPQRIRLMKKILVQPMRDTMVYEYRKNGLTMTLIRREDEVMYFAFDHSTEIQRMHKAFLQKYKVRSSTPLLSLDETRRQMHVESLLEIVDLLFHLEEYSLANEIVENVVAYMQFCAHPAFNLASNNVRLEYEIWENRPFHVAILRYIYLLSNKACHRTALELAKMLMSLDPSDPLAVIFVIDTLALRAREHQWLIDASAFFCRTRDANMLFNIMFSNAMAHFHVAMKTNGDVSKATEMLQDAIIAYPAVATRLLECASDARTHLQAHDLFRVEDTNLGGLNELIKVYAKLSWPRWRETSVFDWFLETVCELTERYNREEDIQERVQEQKIRRHIQFGGLPVEIQRHLGIFRNMSQLIIETHLSNFTRSTAGWDPLLCPGLNRYNYDPYPAPRDTTPNASALYSFEVSEGYSLIAAPAPVAVPVTPEPVAMAFVIPQQQADALARGDEEGGEYLRNYVNQLECLLIINGEYDGDIPPLEPVYASSDEEELLEFSEDRDDGFEENSDCYEDLAEEEEEEAKALPEEPYDLLKDFTLNKGQI